LVCLLSVVVVCHFCFAACSAHGQWSQSHSFRFLSCCPLRLGDCKLIPLADGAAREPCQHYSSTFLLNSPGMSLCVYDERQHPKAAFRILVNASRDFATSPACRWWASGRMKRRLINSMIIADNAALASVGYLLGDTAFVFQPSRLAISPFPPASMAS
jgi:hypothetical protein